MSRKVMFHTAASKADQFWVGGVYLVVNAEDEFSPTGTVLSFVNERVGSSINIWDTDNAVTLDYTAPE